MAKLTEAEVLEIRSEKFTDSTHEEIAKRFGITQTNVWSILNRKSWTHLDATQDAPYEGEQSGNAKLTEQDVLAMRSDLYIGWRHVDIAQHFGIGKSQVSAILLRKTWTHLDAKQDARRKRVSARGEQAGNTKLAECDVIAIRSDLYIGWTAHAIAERFGISRRHVSDILRRKYWTHI